MNGTNETIRAERISFEAMVEALREAGAQFVSLLRAAAPGDGSKPVPGLKWTAAETAVHMLTIVRRGTGDMRRSDSMPGLAELNDQCIEEVDTRDLHEVAELLEGELARLTSGLARLDAATAASLPAVLHAGLTANVPSALSYVLFDLLAHGLDIARATGREWVITPRLAALDLHAALPLLGPWVKPTVQAGPPQHAAIAFPGDPDAVVLRVGDGTYAAQNEARPADVDEVDPVDAFLAVAGRRPAESPTAARLADWFGPI